MSIQSIKIRNLLSFDELIVDNLKDINCIVGKNNTGKSNLLKLIRFFYDKLENKRELPPTLNSNYSAFGTITIIYDISRIKRIVTSDNRNKSKFFKHIYNVLFKDFNKTKNPWVVMKDTQDSSTFELTLKIFSNDSIGWSVKDKKVLNIINYLYPFFEIETRHIDLYDWDKLWYLISRLKSFNVNKLKQDEIINFFDNQISGKSRAYKEYIDKIENITKTSKYSYREKVLSYVKAGLKGHTFLVEEQGLSRQSDGTNSYKFIEIFLNLLISLTRREYISPCVYVDEPETGLHPKRNEELINKLYSTYSSFQGKYKTPYPKIIFSTHSSNIVKEVIKLFDKNQQVLHFSKNIEDNTVIQKMNSQYEDKRFLNIFSDNEARLFFSSFILFVEGATELEIFSNRKLSEKFSKLKKIDVYATNEVVLKYINPSYANTSIPYLVLYDADKFVDINLDTKKLCFKKLPLSISQLKKIYRRAFFGSKKYYIYGYLKQLLRWQEDISLKFENFIYIKNIKYDMLISYINKYFLKKENYFINQTTIEEVLINKDSFALFKKWLFKEYLNSIRDFDNDIPLKNKLIIKQKKIKGLKKFIDSIVNKFIATSYHNKENIYTLFILLFNGKTETLISTDNKKYKNINTQYWNNVTSIKKYIDNHLKPMNQLLKKTSGWATKFLNYAIDEIEQNKGDNSFKNDFKKSFRELYDIITTIEKKP